MQLWPKESTQEDDQWLWFTLYGVIYLSFYFFTSPFVGNPELFYSWTPYVYICMGLYAWLFSAAALHTPVHALGLLDSKIKQPISLLFPFFSTSFAILVIGELLMVLFLPRIIKRRGLSWKLRHITLMRSFMNIVRNSAAVSIACVVLIVHCDTSSQAKMCDGVCTQIYKLHVCQQIFEVTLGNGQILVPASYGGAVFIWSTGMTLALLNFILERTSGYRVISFGWLSSPRNNSSRDKLYSFSSGDEENDETDENNEPHAIQPLAFTNPLDNLSRKSAKKIYLPHDLQLPMVPWYSTFLFDTAFQVLLSLKVFLGRFDQRALQKAHYPHIDDYVFSQVADKDELWLDFMADCGDGFNSSYQIARLLAQPSINVGTKKLPRGEILVLGGDLAYPHPDEHTYQTRLFRVFEYAMPPPKTYNSKSISVTEKTAKDRAAKLKAYEGPTCFAIPGNHDWFDGLNTYTRNICHREWLGGWKLPQKTSHFALQLPHGWWVFGLDLALENDMNLDQLAIFQTIVETRMKPDDAVIIVTHEPRWLLDEMEKRDETESEEKVTYLIQNVLKGRVRLRLAGDLHNYSRHTLVKNIKRIHSNSLNDPKYPNFSEPAEVVRSVDHLIVSGGGGAFLHPTHTYHNAHIRAKGGLYAKKCVYPPDHVSRRYSVLNVFGFRRINWRFDIVGGLAYFLLAFSMFPRCNVKRIYSSATYTLMVIEFLVEILEIVDEMITLSYVSILTFLTMVIVLTAFADCSSLWKKCLTGVTISIVHCFSAISILLIFELIFDLASVKGSLGREGSNSLYRYFMEMSADLSTFLDSIPLLATLTQIYSGFLKFCMTIFDVPEVAAIRRLKVCSDGFSSLSRMELWSYYVTVLPYFWVLATPLVGIIFGTYLYISLNIFGCHYNEAFSSLRVASYKNFLRLHITKDGDLEIHAIGVDKMPQKWYHNPEWSGHNSMERDLPSYTWKHPSYWIPLTRSKVRHLFRMDFENPQLDTKLNTMDRSHTHLVDYLLIRKGKSAK